MSIESYIKDLDPELQKKARACGNAEELLALARENKIPVPDEVLAAIAGGDNADPENCAKPTCPKCGHHNISEDYLHGVHHCNYCGYEW